MRALFRIQTMSEKKNADPETDWGMCTFYGCKAYFGYTCTVYDRVWGSLIKTCPDMRG